jgi:hypothetical protein
VENLEKLVAKAGSTVPGNRLHSKLAVVYFKICGEKTPIAFLKIVEGS